MRVLLIGDIMGRLGRQVVTTLVPSLRDELSLDYVIANAENAAAGRGTTNRIAVQLLESGIDILTGGNHTWAIDEYHETLESDLPVLRPANYPSGAPGTGVWTSDQLIVMNLIGRTFMAALDDPFSGIDALLENIPKDLPVVVDFHAEATSEKQAFGWHLDGRVAAVVGTHTHVATADARLLPRGTAFVTDLGMCGALDAIIGSEVEPVLTRFRTGLPTRIPPATKGSMIFSSVLVEIDDSTKSAISIKRIDRLLEE
jgi:metallophosphoesterase (TIGR00282 family)